MKENYVWLWIYESISNNHINSFTKLAYYWHKNIERVKVSFYKVNDRKHCQKQKHDFAQTVKSDTPSETNNKRLINTIMFWWTDLVRVPVTVKDDDRIGGLQVEPQATGSGTEEEDEVLRPFLVKFL